MMMMICHGLGVGFKFWKRCSSGSFSCSPLTCDKTVDLWYGGHNTCFSMTRYDIGTQGGATVFKVESEGQVRKRSERKKWPPHLKSVYEVHKNKYKDSFVKNDKNFYRCPPPTPRWIIPCYSQWIRWNKKLQCIIQSVKMRHTLSGVWERELAVGSILGRGYDVQPQYRGNIFKMLKSVQSGVPEIAHSKD